MGKKKTGPKTETGKLAVSQNLNPTGWTKNPEAVKAIEVARRLRATKHGLYASVPILCKAEQCPYADACELQQIGMAPYGEKCPIEIAAIEELFYRYCEELGIDPEDKSNTVDLVMVKELVDIDIALLRCDKKMAISADFIIDQVVGVDEDQMPVTRKELHPLTEYKEKLRNSKYKTLQLLNSTRKDKAGDKITFQMDASKRAAELLKVKQDFIELEEEEKNLEESYYKKIHSQNVIDVEPIDYVDHEEELVQENGDQKEEFS